MDVVVRIVLVDMAVQERLRGLSRVRVVLRLRAVVLELVGGEADADRRRESPACEASDRNQPVARAEHRLIVEDRSANVNRTWFSICRSFRDTAEVATKTEQTAQTASAKSTV